MNIILVKLSERLSCTSPVLFLPVVFFAPLPVTFSSSSSFSSAKGFAFLIVSTLLTVCSICLYGHEKQHEAQRCQSNRDEAQHIFHISSNDFRLAEYA